MGKLDLTVGACISFNNKILLLRHTKLNKWLFPGGHVDANETPDQAVLREVKEECGLDFKFSQYSTINDTELRHAVPFHANVHNVGDHDHYCAYYLGTVDDPEVTKNKESTDLKWFTLDEVKALDNVPETVRNMAVYALGL
ncbi:MAG: NUDIX domain-containing protein [Candidatus Micrarchaeota archaeon]